MMPDWRSLHNKHFGQPGVVIGNGPSLKDVPVEWLKRYPTFGTNRIYLLEGFTPTYYVCVNPVVIQQYLQDMLQLPCPKFMPEDPFLETRLPEYFPLRSLSLPLFSFAPSKWIFEGWTVTFVALQLAYFMGFNPVLLVGVDHRYDFSGNPNEERIMDGDDPNHFSAKYFKGARWNNPDLARSEVSYGKAKEAFESNGRLIVNLGPNSALNVFPRGDLEEWS